MRKWLLIILLGALFVFPNFVSAYSDITLESVNVQLWPEYDKPQMLVIDYITLPSDTTFPVTINLGIPTEVGSPLVVAVGASFNEVTDQGVQFSTRVVSDLTIVSIEATAPAIQFEYYDPGLKTNGSARSYQYQWFSEYDVQNFSIAVQQPFDATNLKTSPALEDDGLHLDKLQYYSSVIGALSHDKTFTLDLSYEKPSDTLSISQLKIEPVDISENTPGRVSLNNSIPYLIGGLGVMLIIGGFVYYLKSGNGDVKSSRRRRHTNVNANDSESDVYCSQCGTRAHNGDRFCRVCGSRIRQEE